jgi:uncharacterized membrane protein
LSAGAQRRVSPARYEAAAARLAIAATLALALLELLWETVLAPLRGHPSSLALKALPLALLLPGAMRGVKRQRQWLTLLLPFYFAEALARAAAEHARQAFVAATACIAAATAFLALLGWFRGERLRQRERGALDDA